MFLINFKIIPCLVFTTELYTALRITILWNFQYHFILQKHMFPVNPKIIAYLMYTTVLNTVLSTAILKIVNIIPSLT